MDRSGKENEDKKGERSGKENEDKKGERSGKENEDKKGERSGKENEEAKKKTTAEDEKGLCLLKYLLSYGKLFLLFVSFGDLSKVHYQRILNSFCVLV